MTLDLPTDDELTELSRQLGVSRRDLEAFVEAWQRAGSKEPLIDFLGVIPAQRTSTENLDSEHGSRTA